MDKVKRTQADKFREAAREAETDDNEKRFDKALKRIAVVPPASKDAKPKKRKK